MAKISITIMLDGPELQLDFLISHLLEKLRQAPADVKWDYSKKRK